MSRLSENPLSVKSKSYASCVFDIALVSAHDIVHKDFLTHAELRAVQIELSGKEPVEQVLIVRNGGREGRKITRWQMREMLGDIGFGFGPTLSKKRLSDFVGIMNIKGYTVPFWRVLVGIVKKIFPAAEKPLLLKFAPGKKRLHIRVFEMQDGSWMITAHVDWNWITLNVFRVLHAHIGSGKGDYASGTRLMQQLFVTFNALFRQGKPIQYGDIAPIVR